MSEANENITNQPEDELRGDAITNEPPRSPYAYEPAQFALPPKSKTWLYVLLGVGIPVVLICLVGSAIALLIPGVANVRHAAVQTQSINNVKIMTLAINNIATNSPSGDIPPAYGPFPVGSGTNQSFFVNLLPYIEQNHLYTNLAANLNKPLMVYIAPADPRNPGTNATISYCTNGTVLSGSPRFPSSFGGRTSSIICVMERSGLDGAHTWNNKNSVLGTPGTAPPFPQLGADPSLYQDGSPQGFTAAGCVVSFADGRAKSIVVKDQAFWNGLCDPAGSPPPPGW